MIIQIAAASENNVLGKDNKIVWHLPDDYKRFKAITTGHYIILGRKTYESLGKPLPNRPHIIVTRKKGYKIEGCQTANSIEEAIKLAPKNENVFVIGGGEIYQQALHLTDKIELTRVHATIEGDTFFPEIRNDEWQLIKEEYHPKDEKHALDFTYQTFIRKNSTTNL
jgi:dihydrofolate reductase